VADVVTDVLAGLDEAGISLTAEELAEALWLCRQARQWGGLPAGRAVADARAAASAAPQLFPWEPGGATPMGAPAGRRRGGSAVTPGQGAPGGSGEAPHALAYASHQVEPDPGTTTPVIPVRLADVAALPQARDLARALRPLRYDPQRRYPASGIDEEATAHRIAQTGLRLPVLRTTRRRRLDLDIVYDVGGSGPVWRQLAIELRAMLRVQGAFRSIRSWVLNSESDGAPQLTRQDGRRRYPWQAVCELPRRPLVIVLTDGAGQAWQAGSAHEPLREWAARSSVVVAHLLPPKMWQRGALRPLPVIFHPAAAGYHRGFRVDVTDRQLAVIRLPRGLKNASTAIPVIGLEASWVRAWLPLLRGGQAGAVPGCALLIPPPRPASERPRPVPRPISDRDAARRVTGFMISASPNARRLAELLSVIHPTLPALRKIHRELIPHRSTEEVAEVLLGGLLYWTTPTAESALTGKLDLNFHSDEVREILQRRPGGADEFAGDVERVARALWSDPGSGPAYEGLAFVPGIAGELLSGKFAGVRPRPGELPILPPYPVPSRVTVIDAPADHPPVPAPEGEQGEAELPPAAIESGPGPDGEEIPVEVVKAPGGAADVQVGIFGSTQSGRTTFLAVIGMLCTDWSPTPWRRGEQWRVRIGSNATREFVQKAREGFRSSGSFPASNVPGEAGEAGEAGKFTFLLERRRLARRSLGWQWRAEQVANISLALQDRAGADFQSRRDRKDRSARGSRYLADSDVLVYFFDPTYDSRPGNGHSIDYLAGVQADLGLAAMERRQVRGPYLPQHIAVCVPKLDDQAVFDTARTYDCLRTDPGTGLPWVPPNQADRLFDMITYGQCSPESDLLRRLVRKTFDPARTSYHALSSIGFWAGEDGTVDEDDVSSRARRRGSSLSAPEWQLRGRVDQIKPVHVLDPLLAVIERHLRQAGR
jgi:hypothetical protein